MQKVPQLIKNNQTELNTLEDNSYIFFYGKNSGFSKLQKKKGLKNKIKMRVSEIIWTKDFEITKILFFLAKII